VGASPVKRCVAVAAHGKRCQQTPFRGSPYCWHHTQSRKVWAPSRVRPVAPPKAVLPAPDAAPAAVPPPPPPPVPVARVRPRAATAAELGLAIAQLCQQLDPKVLGALTHFVAHADTGSLVLEKDDGELMDVRVERPRPARRTRQAEG
jgi:hypothetical protein